MGVGVGCDVCIFTSENYINRIKRNLYCFEGNIPFWVESRYWVLQYAKNIILRFFYIVYLTIRFKLQLYKGYECCITVQIIKRSEIIFVRVSLGVCFCLDVCILTWVNYIKRTKRKFHCFLQFPGVKFIKRAKTNLPLFQFTGVNCKKKNQKKPLIFLEVYGCKLYK